MKFGRAPATQIIRIPRRYKRRQRIESLGSQVELSRARVGPHHEMPTGHQSVAVEVVSVRGRLRYWSRIFGAYFGTKTSQLSFWHETPASNEMASTTEVGEYYMVFADKAHYAGPFDANGIPMLDYRGELGLQYNPIAIAQFGLGAYNQLRRTGADHWREKVACVAHWLTDNLEVNAHGIPVWHHDFDWEYRDTLKAPWYSGLAQGQAISLLIRAHQELGDPVFLEAAENAFVSLGASTREGGVVYVDEHGHWWIEEYIVDPPTHILNGFLWALWGVHDYLLAFGTQSARQLWDESVNTLVESLPTYDIGFWSLYEHSGTRLRMLASPFYHSLHIVQLRVMSRLTGLAIFEEYADKWETYRQSRLKRGAALAYKGVFKLCYY
jgi:heparosan-N-sulfate-glucuronate 5-epimerase